MDEKGRKRRVREGKERILKEREGKRKEIIERKEMVVKERDERTGRGRWN